MTDTTYERPTATELVSSINGFDEVAIAQQFGRTVADLKESGDKTAFLRALIFTDQRRAGAKDPDAYLAAMTLPMVELGSYFPEAPHEVMPDDPETEVGKDSTP